MNQNTYVIGLDFGTDSVRAVLVNTTNGSIVASEVHWYKRWKNGQYCCPEINQYRQHPLDHLEGMDQTISGVVQKSGVDPTTIKGICIDTTGSSPVAVNEKGTALSLLDGFEENPNAMVILWKDHTSVAEADEINQLARTWGGEDYTKYEGGIYSSEWFWAKVLHVIRQDDQVKQTAYSWMEHCDLMTFILTGGDLKSFRRSRCAAGHKAMWHTDWDGLPADIFLGKLDPHLVKIKQHLYTNTFTSDLAAGKLSPEWAQKLGLNENVVVSVGTFDAHAGAIGAEIKENTLVRVMGTSTCDIVVASPAVIQGKTVHGICGQVNGSVLPEMIGLEAGQSAFGDVLAWFIDLISWPLTSISSLDLTANQIHRIKEEMIIKLSSQAAQTPVDNSAPLALDWLNGRRTPDANQHLKAAIINLSLGTQAAHIFRALVEAICFGSKTIVNRFNAEGVEINNVVGIGGVAKKSAFIMQTLSNVLNMPIKVAVSEQAPALGAAMYAAVASGIYSDIRIAIKAMGCGFEKSYFPQKETVKKYEQLFQRYIQLGEFIENKN